MLHHAHLGQGEAIVAREPGPAVLALQKAGAERRLQLGVAREVADAPEPAALRRLRAHGEGIRIAEAEGLAHG